MPEWVTVSFPIIRIILVVLIALLSLLMVVLVLMQPGGSSGLEAVSGAQDTFFGKNKGKTTEGTLKRITVISAIIILVLTVVFWVTIHFLPLPEIPA